MKHLATPFFWVHFHELPAEIQMLAKKNYALLKANPDHASLHLKLIGGKIYSVRIGIKYRALGTKIPEGVLWFWVGTHAQYDRLIS